MNNGTPQQIVISEGNVKYEKSANNASISASASEIFFSAQPDKEANQQYGSFNYLEVVNSSASKIAIDLDGLSTRRRILFANAALVIRTQERTFFNNVKVTNLDSSNTVAANEINLNARIVR